MKENNLYLLKVNIYNRDHNKWYPFTRCFLFGIKKVEDTIKQYAKQTYYKYRFSIAKYKRVYGK